MSKWAIHPGDTRASLARLPERSVRCCVTSPPYWGLRDYGHDGQIGLEASPAAYIAALVEVFAAVRRVLADDGTLFLNLGDSYFGSNQTGGTNSKEGSAKRVARMFSASRPGAPSRGTGNTGRQGLITLDSSCSDLCDGCRAALSLRTTDTARPTPLACGRRGKKGRGSEPADSASTFSDAGVLSAPASTTTESSSPLPEGCHHCANCDACLAVLRSSSRDASLCVRRVRCIGGTERRGSGVHNSCTGVSGLACTSLGTESLKPKDLMMMPARVAIALQADGWYLRSDIIWHKPNPMPESVTDRPTKAHEYLFLLAKNERYFYDADAIAEPCLDEEYRTRGKVRPTAEGGAGFEIRGGLHKQEGGRETRNKRDVWTINTQPYSGAHFATFPEALVEPCILAGSAVGDTVLDPFSGSGTTGAVAVRHGRNYIGCELNPAYIALSEKRIGDEAPLFAKGGAA